MTAPCAGGAAWERRRQPAADDACKAAGPLPQPGRGRPPGGGERFGDDAMRLRAGIARH